MIHIVYDWDDQKAHDRIAIIVFGISLTRISQCTVTLRKNRHSDLYQGAPRRVTVYSRSTFDLHTRVIQFPHVIYVLYLLPGVPRRSTRYWYHIPTTVGIGVTTKQSKAHQCIIRDCGIRPDSCMDMANRFRKNPRQVCYPSCMNIGMIKRPPGASGSSVR